MPKFLAPLAPQRAEKEGLSEEYFAYLASPEWAAVRFAAVARAGYVCEECGREGPLQVHHLTYARFGAERDTDLIALCARCHRRADNARRKFKGWCERRYGVLGARFAEMRQAWARFKEERGGEEGENGR